MNNKILLAIAVLGLALVGIGATRAYANEQRGPRAGFDPQVREQIHEAIENGDFATWSALTEGRGINDLTYSHR